MSDITGIYFDLSETELIEKKRLINDELTKAINGRVKASASAQHSGERDLMTVDQLKAELREVQEALRKIDPDTYGSPAPSYYRPVFS